MQRVLKIAAFKIISTFFLYFPKLTSHFQILGSSGVMGWFYPVQEVFLLETNAQRRSPTNVAKLNHRAAKEIGECFSPYDNSLPFANAIASRE